MSEYEVHRFKEFILPVSVQLQGSIEKDPDKIIINKIINEIRAQAPTIQTGKSGMIIQIPPFYLWFKTYNDKDFQILVMGLTKKVLIHIKQLNKYEDVSWNFVDNANEFPDGMIERLKEKSGIK